MPKGPGRPVLSSAVDALLGSGAPLPAVGERRRLREAHGLTQAQVAQALGVRRATVGAWESGGAEPRRPEREAYVRLLDELAGRYPAAVPDTLATPDDGVTAEPAGPGSGPGPAATVPAVPVPVPDSGRGTVRADGPAALKPLFRSFLHSAWRLESRRTYAWHARRPEYVAFATGRHVEWDLESAWCRERRAQRALGKRYQRVRVMDEPYTECQLYLLLQNTPRNAAAGEDVRFLTRRHADELGLPREDFWIFDARTVAVLRFDDESDESAGVELITEPAEVLRHIQVREAAWHHAVSQERMAEALGV